MKEQNTKPPFPIKGWGEGEEEEGGGSQCKSNQKTGPEGKGFLVEPQVVGVSHWVLWRTLKLPNVFMEDDVIWINPAPHS